MEGVPQKEAERLPLSMADIRLLISETLSNKRPWCSVSLSSLLTTASNLNAIKLGGSRPAAA